MVFGHDRGMFFFHAVYPVEMPEQVVSTDDQTVHAATMSGPAYPDFAVANH